MILGRPDIVVLDLALEGARTAVMRALLAHAPTVRSVIYVSCEPSPFARDLAVVLRRRWCLAGLRAFDIFPMTQRVELLAAQEPPGRAQELLRGDASTYLRTHAGGAGSDGTARPSGTLRERRRKRRSMTPPATQCRAGTPTTGATRRS